MAAVTAIGGNMNKHKLSGPIALAVVAFALVAGTVAAIVPQPLSAQSASVTGATLTWYGVYAAATSTSVSSTKEIGTGIKPPATNSDRVSLPSSGSILIGYGYNLVGSPPTALVALTYRTLFPDGRYQDNIYDRLAINRKDLFIGQRLNSNSAAGTYTLQVWHSGAMLLEKSFTVR
jgi:hypothetical protein